MVTASLLCPAKVDTVSGTRLQYVARGHGTELGHRPMIAFVADIRSRGRLREGERDDGGRIRGRVSRRSYQEAGRFPFVDTGLHEPGRCRVP
jgi:hypothetical protein